MLRMLAGWLVGHNQPAKRRPCCHNSTIQFDPIRLDSITHTVSSAVISCARLVRSTPTPTTPTPTSTPTPATSVLFFKRPHNANEPCKLFPRQSQQRRANEGTNARQIQPPFSEASGGGSRSKGPKKTTDANCCPSYLILLPLRRRYCRRCCCCCSASLGARLQGEGKFLSSTHLMYVCARPVQGSRKGQAEHKTM